jgi:ABC-2 type transport system permease protein
MIFFEIIRLYIFNSKIKLARGIQYKFDFFLGIFVAFGLSGLGPIFQILIFTKTRGYPTWNLNQIILFQGVLLIWLGIKDVLFGEVRTNAEAVIRSGEFDMILLKPYPSIWVIISRGFYYHAFGTLIVGIIIVLISIKTMALQIKTWQIIFLLCLFVAGIILYLAITIAYCSITLFLVYMSRLGEIIDKFFYFSNFPIEIFSPILRITFLIILPISIWAYLPTQVLLNRINILISMASMFVCIILFILSLIIWNHFQKKYTSAGG